MQTCNQLAHIVSCHFIHAAKETLSSSPPFKGTANQGSHVPDWVTREQLFYLTHNSGKQSLINKSPFLSTFVYVAKVHGTFPTFCHGHFGAASRDFSAPQEVQGAFHKVVFSILCKYSIWWGPIINSLTCRLLFCRSLPFKLAVTPATLLGQSKQCWVVWQPGLPSGRPGRCPGRQAPRLPALPGPPLACLQSSLPFHCLDVTMAVAAAAMTAERRELMELMSPGISPVFSAVHQKLYSISTYVSSFFSFFFVTERQFVDCLYFPIRLRSSHGQYSMHSRRVYIFKKLDV